MPTPESAYLLWINQEPESIISGQLEGGWFVCMFWGTSPNRPFPDLNTGASSLTLYEPNQFVLGHGTWMEGGSYSD